MAKVKKKELGRGIRALLANIDTQTKENQEEVVKQLSNTVARIPVDCIEVNPYQPRKEFDLVALEELAKSIQTYGLIQPITVRRLNENAYQLISGERRLRASKIAGLTELPVYIRLANDQEMLEMALVENIQRENLNAIEVAFTYQRLMDECKLTHDSLSQRVGKKRSTVTNYLRLLDLPPEIQSSLKLGEVSMGHARALLGVKEDIALQLMLFNQIKGQGLSVRAVEELIRRHSENKQPKRKNTAALPDAYIEVQNNLRNHLGTRVQLKRTNKGKGQIVINFNSDEELNRLLDVIEKD